MTDLPQHLVGMNDQERLEHETETLKILAADTFALLMEDMSINQAELARRMGASDANVSKLLSGSQNMKLSTLAKIGLSLGVRVQTRLVPAQRSGTAASGDGPLPDWVTGRGVESFHATFGRTNLPASGRIEDRRTQWETVDVGHA